jgi:hypothetical protein
VVYVYISYQFSIEQSGPRGGLRVSQAKTGVTEYITRLHCVLFIEIQETGFNLCVYSLAAPNTHLQTNHGIELESVFKKVPPTLVPVRPAIIRLLKGGGGG